MQKYAFQLQSLVKTYVGIQKKLFSLNFERFLSLCVQHCQLPVFLISWRRVLVSRIVSSLFKSTKNLHLIRAVLQNK